MKSYHIFTNNFDEWTDNKKEALAIFKDFVKECGTARLYEFDTASEDEDGVYQDGDCIKSFGEYPL